MLWFIIIILVSEVCCDRRNNSTKVKLYMEREMPESLNYKGTVVFFHVWYIWSGFKKWCHNLNLCFVALHFTELNLWYMLHINFIGNLENIHQLSRLICVWCSFTDSCCICKRESTGWPFSEGIVERGQETFVYSLLYLFCSFMFSSLVLYTIQCETSPGGIFKIFDWGYHLSGIWSIKYHKHSYLVLIN